jgi:hypothetical protein
LLRDGAGANLKKMHHKFLGFLNIKKAITRDELFCKITKLILLF